MLDIPPPPPPPPPPPLCPQLKCLGGGGGVSGVVPCGAPYTPLLMCPSTAEEEEEPPLPTYLAHTLLQVRLIY